MLRVFTAIQLPDAVIRKIVSACGRFAGSSGLKWVEPSGLHLTLNFVGDVEDREIPNLCTAFARNLDNLDPFPIQLQGMGAFPNFDRPRVLWLGVVEGEEPLVELNRRFRDIIEEYGFVQEKRFTPHVTLARTQKSNLAPNEITRMQQHFDRLNLDRFRASEVVVFNSLLEKKGPTYVRLSTMKL